MMEKLDMKKKNIYSLNQLKHPKTFWGQSKACGKGNVKSDAFWYFCTFWF